MKIQYTTVKNINLYFDLLVLDYLKKITSNNAKSFETWKNAKLSLIDDNKNIIWTKEFQEIKEEDISASAN